MKEISQITRNLELRDDGIWFSRSGSKISYPDDGNLTCFQVEDRSFWFHHRNACILEAVKRYPPAGEIFDIGGGNGFVAQGLIRNGYPAVLIEPGITGVRNAKSRGVQHTICSSLEDAGIIDKSLPAAGIFDVLEHIDDDAGFLTNLRRYLVDDGRLYITVPAFKTLWSPEDDYANHFRRYTIRELASKLNNAGYSIDYSTYFFSMLVVPIFVFRALPGKIGLSRKNTPEQIMKEHNPNKVLTGMIDIYGVLEQSFIAKGKVPFGTSCLVVARANQG